MLRALILCLAELMLAGCAFRLPAAPPPLPTSTPTPEPAAAFESAYADVLTAYNAIGAVMRSGNLDEQFKDAAFRKRVQGLAQEWRTAANTLRYMEQPQGEKWDEAWPRITDAMAEYAYVASLIESAARENNPFLMLPGTGRLDLATSLLDEAMGILEK